MNPETIFEAPPIGCDETKSIYPEPMDFNEWQQYLLSIKNEIRNN